MRFLLLGGTAEARGLAPILRDAGHAVTASLAGITETPADYGVATRYGGFGGAEGLAHWLAEHAADALIDATHPFAGRMPVNAAKAAETLGLPRLRLIRPEWPVAPQWHAHATLAEAVAAIPKGARVLAAVGRGDLRPWRDRADLSILLRTIEDPGPLPKHVTPLRARPPFAFRDEAALIATRRLTHLVAKNSGGARAKLDAADAAGAAVHLIARPPPPPGPVVSEIDSVVEWVAEIRR